MENYKNREIDYDKPVEIYRCLNRKGFVFSVRQNGLVVAHTSEIILKDCDMIVNEAGKKRAIETGVRNVHAFVRGMITDSKLPTIGLPLFYNPFSKYGFIALLGQVKKCDRVIIKDKQVYCQNENSILR